jgi:putative ABC transport system permease protein
MLGVVIGMAAVVALVSIGQGAQAQITGQIEGIGANLIAVIPVRVEHQGAMSSGGTPQTLLLSDAQAVGGVLGVTAVTPSIERVDSSSRLGERSMPQSMVPPRGILRCTM